METGHGVLTFRQLIGWGWGPWPSPPCMRGIRGGGPKRGPDRGRRRRVGEGRPLHSRRRTGPLRHDMPGPLRNSADRPPLFPLSLQAHPRCVLTPRRGVTNQAQCDCRGGGVGGWAGGGGGYLHAAVKVAEAGLAEAGDGRVGGVGEALPLLPDEAPHLRGLPGAGVKRTTHSEASC
jgi:hypothetical protein